MCSYLEADEEGYIKKHALRLEDQKRKTAEEFQRLNFRLIAVGDSFNDIGMIRTAEKGFLFNPSEKVKAAHPDIPVVTNYEELKAKIVECTKVDGADGRGTKRKDAP